jgi:hypothetical protein
MERYIRRAEARQFGAWTQGGDQITLGPGQGRQVP